MKNYVYKLNANGIIYASLDGAVESAYEHIKANSLCRARHTKPVVSKVDGGYMVVVVDINGNVYRRRIDVFVPLASKKAFKFYLDETNERVKNKYYDYQQDYCQNNCDDCCYKDDCADCEIEDEDEEYEEEYEDEEDEEEDEPTQCCEHCDKECEIEDIVQIDGFEMCKDCAIEYLEDNY